MPEPIKKILVIKLGALGDFIQALGPMKSIRQHHLNDHITLLTTKSFYNIAKDSGYFDTILLDQKPKFFEIKKIINLIKILNKPNFKRVYDLQNNDRTSFYFKLFFSKPEWVGVAKNASHRNASKQRTAGQAFDGHVMTLALAGINNISVDDLSWITADISAFSLQKNYALLIPGSAPQHPYKRWGISNYKILCGYLLEKNIQPVLIGSDAEIDLATEIAISNPSILNLTGKTALNQIVVLARNACLAIGNDTGPMHMVAPTNCPTIILFSKYSNPVRHAPKGDNIISLQIDNLQDMTVETVIDACKTITP